MEKITVTCRCGASLSAPASAAGKKAPCPRCGTLNIVPGGAAAPAAQWTVESAPARQEAADGAAAAPGAAGEMPAEAGEFDQAWGHEVDLGPVPHGVLLRGVACCVVATAVVALGWYMAATSMHKPLMPAALAVGVAAGAAMMLGARRQHITCGLAAAAIALAAIIVVKMAIFTEVVLPELKKKEVVSAPPAAVGLVLAQADRMDAMARNMPQMPGTDERSLQQMDPHEAEAIREMDGQRREMLEQARSNMRATAEAVKQQHHERVQQMREDLTFASHMADCSNIGVMLVTLVVAGLVPTIRGK